MSGFAGRNAKADTGATRLTGMKVQTTVLGRAVPWVFGTNRIAPNIVQYDDFQAIEKKEKQGGKGGGGSSTSYEYRAAVIMAICRGPVAGIGQIWADKKKHTLSSLGLDFYTGTDTQAAHPHWATNHADRALPYRNLSYAAKASMDLGSGGSVEKHTFEVQSLTRVSDAIPDARVEAVITALVTDVVDGLGLAPTRLGDLVQLSSFCAANGIFISPVYEDQKEAKALLSTLAEIAQCGMLWSDGKLKFVPYGDTAASGNGANYVPAVEAIPELTEDDLLPQGDGPIVRIKRKGVGGVKNHVQVKYSDRSNEYNAATVESKDLGSIERFGVLSADVEEFPEICVGSVAQKLADFRRDRAAAVRNTYMFKTSLRWDRLEVMDIVALTYAPEALAQVTVRITSIEEADDELQIEAEDCPLGAQQVVQITPQSPVGGGVDYNQSPGSVATPVVFEPPLSLTGGRPEIWISTSGGQLWGGADVHISSDGSTYERVAELTSKARHGVLTASLPLGGLVDASSTLAVSLAVSSGTLMGGTTQDAQDLTTLCYVDGELLAYRDATLTGLSTYNLQYLIRGAHGTDVAAHAAGTPFVRLDDSVLRYEYPKQLLGRTVYLKFTSRNIYGAGAQSLADVAAYPYTITGAPLAGVQNLALLKPWTGTEAQVRWDLVDGAISYDVEALAGAPLATVRSVSAVTSGQWTYAADDARADGGPWRSIAIRVRPRAVTGKAGPWRQIVASNPQIGALAGLGVQEGIKQAMFQCARPADTDFAGLLVWVSATSGFTPDETTLLYDGSDTFVTIGTLANGAPMVAGTPYYLRAAGYDDFGRDALTLSSEITFSVVGLVPDVGSIIDTMLADGAIGRTKFAQGLSPVETLSALPPAVGSAEGRQVMLTTDGKLYRFHAGAWTRAVDGADLVANSVTTGSISAGAVRAEQIAAGAITAKHLLIADLDNLVSNGAGVSVDGWFGTSGLDGVRADPAPWWAALGVASGTTLTFAGRDSLFGARFSVRPGDQFFGRADTNPMGGGTLLYPFGIGLFVYDSSGEVVQFLLLASREAGGSGYAPISGSGTIAPGGAMAQVWVVVVGPQSAIYTAAGQVVHATNIEIRRKSGGELIVDGSITAAKILAGSIQTQHLVANVITADKLAVNAVTADKIAAGAVQAQHISSGLPGGNLIPNSALAATFLDSSGLLQADGHTFGGAHILTNITCGLNLAGDAWRPVGLNALSLQQYGAVGAGDPAAYADIQGPAWCVVAGQPYEFSFYSGAHRAAVTGYVVWCSTSGAVLGYTMLNINSGEMSGGQSLDGYKRLFVAVIAPAGAVTAQLNYRKLASVPGAVDSWLFAACPMGAPALSAAQATPSPWVPTGLGTQISGGIIKTGTVTADRIGVSQLSAISADLGSINAGSLNINNRFVVSADGSTTIRSATSGQRTELDNQQMRVYDSAGVMRVRLGIW